jgi:hypothetical protein
LFDPADAGDKIAAGAITMASGRARNHNRDRKASDEIEARPRFDFVAGATGRRHVCLATPSWFAFAMQRRGAR